MCEPLQKLNWTRGLPSATCTEFNKSQVMKKMDHKRVGTWSRADCQQSVSKQFVDAVQRFAKETFVSKL